MPAVARKEFQFEINGGIIAGQEWKPEHPTKQVLLLHGWQDNSNSYRKLVPLLQQDWWMVAFDFPGHGLSSPRAPGAPYHITDWNLDVQRVVNKLGWKKFTIIGHSMGVGVAQNYAALFPEVVEAVVCLDAVKQRSEDPGTTQKVMRNAVVFLTNYDDVQKQQLDTFNSPEEAVDWWYEKNKVLLTKESAQVLFEQPRGLKEVSPGKFQPTRDPRLTFPPLFRIALDQHRVLLKELKCDLLIIKAMGAQDWEAAEIEKEFLEMFAKNCHRFVHAKVEGLHHVHLNEPEEVAPLIVHFLQNQK